MNQTRPPDAAREPPARRSFLAWVIGLIVVAAVLVALYTAFLLWWSYSEGERAGVLQKFSKRGWICKTHEGELAQYVVGGVAPQIWYFSVRDTDVVDRLHAAVGQQVRIHYTEHPGLPTNCFGETDYFAETVEVIGAPQPLPAPSGMVVDPAAAPPTAPPPP